MNERVANLDCAPNGLILSANVKLGDCAFDIIVYMEVAAYVGEST